MIWLPLLDVASSSALRISILLPSTALAVIAHIPPTQAPTKEERAKYAAAKDFFTSKWVRSLFIGVCRTLYWGNLLCETALAVAPYVPSAVRESIPALPATQHLRITPWWLAGCALMACGGAVRLLCFRHLGRFFTFELSIQKGHALVTNGPYAVVRHPSYTGSMLVGAGTVLCHFGPGSWYAECVGWGSVYSGMFMAAWAGWCVVVPALLTRRTSTEDATLRSEFGSEWDSYAKRTPYKLVPYIF
ncbi:hypothetical protein PHLGIDRAFT_123011 [Phlebiopsis gigantea 11061_1 CR5-6]|uniref:Protein-S-isoprenylcysteine O-methyltransferase n=1 Tax=Phlebiopsis gigantea (strain 11061_1 CR5-6) TaxID=745531 RepID=A0A0C3NBJ3_PHLG1|nr:hypothetical protein PHLGIDRAFT_123011 [Phlebiopsis gigantea 11061_1 CR5-6]